MKLSILGRQIAFFLLIIVGICGIIWFGAIRRLPIPQQKFITAITPGEHTYSVHLPELKSCYVVIGYDVGVTLPEFSGSIRIACDAGVGYEFNTDRRLGSCNWLDAKGLHGIIIGHYEKSVLNRCSNQTISLQMPRSIPEGCSLWLCYTRPFSSR
jgi:hypothetical protein